ncbi:MAG TPA: hypothetical protein VM056_02800 [Terriglobales bacterium]|nr:hypothetical protein [Terriglobales bacterium]
MSGTNATQLRKLKPGKGKINTCKTPESTAASQYFVGKLRTLGV